MNSIFGPFLLFASYTNKKFFNFLLNILFLLRWTNKLLERLRRKFLLCRSCCKVLRSKEKFFKTSLFPLVYIKSCFKSITWVMKITFFTSTRWSDNSLNSFCHYLWSDRWICSRYESFPSCTFWAFDFSMVIIELKSYRW